jgi:hypothetical protein
MGADASKIKIEKDIIANTIPVEGYWVNDIKTGRRWVTNPIQSGPTVVKKKLANSPIGEVWGPYDKLYTRSMFGQNLFTPPESVDGVPILCRCRDIPEYVRSNGNLNLGAGGALVLGQNPPACWEDSETIMNPTGGRTFDITLRHPGFYINAISSNGLLGLFFGGKRKRRPHSKKKLKNKTRRR